MSFDYSNLLKVEGNDYILSWRNYWDENRSLPANFFHLVKSSIYLPLDYYKIITAYAFIPSALARIVPYLFLYGISGSGKSTLGKLIANLHGIKITSSSDTFAAIRNSLTARRKITINVASNDDKFPDGYYKEIETNTMMVWDDIDASVFTSKGDIYRLFKFGYDKSCDTIEISSEIPGKNLVFHCFCPKVFSSIAPLHLNDEIKELRRRLLVIPTKRIEDLTEVRKQELNICNGIWEQTLIDVSNLDWQEFSALFKQYWHLEKAKEYLSNRKQVIKQVTGLSSQERIISIDLITTGVTIGIWQDIKQAETDIKNYWQWFKGEINIGESPLVQLLKEIIEQEETNALRGNLEPIISNYQIKACCNSWLDKGYLLDKPNSKTIKNAMSELGYRLIIGGKWVKS